MTDRTVIATIVEGHGEVRALPVLIRKIAAEEFGRWDVDLPQPHRLKRTQMTLRAELHRAALVQRERVVSRGGVLVVADADDDCPVTLADQLRDAVRPVPIEIAIAAREFESWFLTSIDSLRGHPSVRDDATFPDEPDDPHGGKGALAARMTESYKETLHQPKFAALLDPKLAKRSRSFRHLVGCVGRLLGAAPHD